MKHLWAVGAALALVIVPLAAEPVAQQVADSLIVPGERVGPISVGMSTKQLFAVMNDPVETHTLGDNGRFGTQYLWGSWASGLQASTDKNGVVTEVTTTQPAFATSDKVQIGSSSLMVTAILGRPGTSYQTLYRCSANASFHCAINCYKSGLEIAFNLDDGRVIQIRVRSPKNALKPCDRK